MGTVHLQKLCVGAEDLRDLVDWQRNPRAKGPDGRVRHVTRMWPKRADDLLAGGSLYWVIKGVVTCRQRILALDEVRGADGHRRCGIVLDPEIVRVAPVQRRPFQGWRYLATEDAPPDLRHGSTNEEALPPGLQSALAEIGVL